MMIEKQGIIQKKSAPGSLTMPLVISDKKALFSKDNVVLRYFWVKLCQKCLFKDSGHCPKILDYTQRNSISHSDKFLNIVQTGLWPIWFCCPWECNF